MPAPMRPRSPPGLVGTTVLLFSGQLSGHAAHKREAGNAIKYVLGKPIAENAGPAVGE